VSADKGHGAQLPANPADNAFSGQKSMCIKALGFHGTKKVGMKLT
jgi:hypothetical protein